MKKSLFFILILSLLVCFSACKKEPLTPAIPTETTAPAVTEGTTVPTVQTESTLPPAPPAPKAGLLLRNLTAGEQDARNLQSGLESLGYEVLTRDAENDQSKQNEQATALLSEGCEVLVLQPVMTSGLDVLLGELGNVPVLILDAKPELEQLPENVAVLCPKEEQAGEVQAKLPPMLPGGGDLNGDGKVSVLMIQGPADHVDATARAAAFLVAMEAETYTVLEIVEGAWTQEGGKTACAPMLSKYGPDLEVIVTSGEDMAFGVLEAIENGGWIPGKDMYVLSVGNSEAIRSQVQQGRIHGISAPDSEGRLLLMQELVQALIDGTVEEQIKYVDYITITP